MTLRYSPYGLPSTSRRSLYPKSVPEAYIDHMGLSMAERFASLTPEVREEWLGEQPESVLEEIVRGEWWWTSRPEQVPPDGPWMVHLALAGRGWGKSRAGSEWLIQRTQDHPVDRFGVPTEWIVVAETLSDTRVICLEGPSGILRVLERRQIPYKYIKHPKPKLLIGEHETKIYFEGADNPDVGRGYNAAGGWLDEVAKWKYLRESWYEGIMPSLRADLIDDHPRVFITTTPKPVDLIKEWVSQTDGSVSVVRGSTFDNRANLSAQVLLELEKRYAGTSIGLQELYGELLDLFDGAIFKLGDIERNRVNVDPEIEVARVMALDPALTGEHDEMGIIVASRDPNDHIYILADASVQAVGREAADHAWTVFHDWGCDIMVYESNLGKAWMAQVLSDSYRQRQKEGLFPEHTNPPIVPVDSQVGKKLRAEPVAHRYEQGRIHHVGRFPLLETQMTEWDPNLTRESPDRLDALVHACRNLMTGERRRARIHTPTRHRIAVYSPTI